MLIAAGPALGPVQPHDATPVVNPEEIALDDTVGDEEDGTTAGDAAAQTDPAVLAPHPEDIDIGDDVEEEEDDNE